MVLIINNTEITTNEAGMYSINDLHKSTGSGDEHKPTYFFRNHGVKAFIDELQKVTPTHLLINKIAGRNGGTWVDELLVYKYAAWVSAEFDVRVFKTFQALSKGDNDKAAAYLSNDKIQIALIEKRDRIMASKVSPGKKADKLALLEKEWITTGSIASQSLSIRRGQSFKFIEAQESLLNEIQTKFEF